MSRGCGQIVSDGPWSEGSIELILISSPGRLGGFALHHSVVVGANMVHHHQKERKIKESEKFNIHTFHLKRYM